MNNEMNFLIYNVPGEEASVSVIVKNETIWLTQKAMAELFGVGVPAISKHLKNIFEEGELMEEVVISILETTTEHGAIAGKTQTNRTKFYNLDAIISVGYRVTQSDQLQDLGDRYSERVYAQRFCSGRRTFETGQGCFWQRLFQRTVRTCPFYPG